MARPIEPLKLRAAAATHVGRVRTNNEDSVLCAIDRAHRVEGLFAVADGMGGHAAGEIASQIAIGAIRYVKLGDETMNDLCAVQLDGPRPPHLPGPLICHKPRPCPDHDHEKCLNTLREAFTRAHHAILNDVRAHPERAGMGTTLTVCAIHGGSAFIAHAGDSSAFLIRDGVISALTQPHATFHALDNCLGVMEQSFRGADCKTVILAPNDVILLATDGLTDDITPRAIIAAIRDFTPEQFPRILIERALEASGRDNVTVVAIGIESL